MVLCVSLQEGAQKKNETKEKHKKKPATFAQIENQRKGKNWLHPPVSCRRKGGGLLLRFANSVGGECHMWPAHSRFWVSVRSNPLASLTPRHPPHSFVLLCYALGFLSISFKILIFIYGSP